MTSFLYALGIDVSVVGLTSDDGNKENEIRPTALSGTKQPVVAMTLSHPSLEAPDAVTISVPFVSHSPNKPDLPSPHIPPSAHDHISSDKIQEGSNKCVISFIATAEKTHRHI
jgi:hypothetical protein